MGCLVGKTHIAGLGETEPARSISWWKRLVRRSLLHQPVPDRPAELFSPSSSSESPREIRPRSACLERYPEVQVTPRDRLAPLQLHIRLEAGIDALGELHANTCCQPERIRCGF